MKKLIQNYGCNRIIIIKPLQSVKNLEQKKGKIKRKVLREKAMIIHVDELYALVNKARNRKFWSK